MKLSTKGRYGLKAMYYMAVSPQELFNLKDLCAKTGVTEAYLEKLLGVLRKAGLVDASRGVKGGYRLSKEPSDITIWQILSTLEGDLYVADCANGQCNKKLCPNKTIFSTIYQQISQVLKQMTLQEFVDKNKENL